MLDTLDEIEYFSNIIIQRVETGKIEYLDAIASYCLEKELDIESIVGLLSPSIISKIEEEAINNRILKSTSKRLEFV